MQIALAQTIYNLLGILLFYPIPFMRHIPINLAMKLGDKTAKYKWFALLYIVVIFFLMPGLLLALSLLPSTWVVCIVSLLAVVIGLLILINLLQAWSNFTPFVHLIHRH
jgi:sodium-dependent phosphate cotransporter